MDQHFTEQGGKVLETFSQQLEQSAAYSSAMLTALNFWLGPTQEIVIAGKGDATDTKQMIQLVRNKFLPNAIVLLHKEGKAGSDIEQVTAFIKQQIAIGNKATAYICENYVCSRPVNEFDDFEKMVSNLTQDKKD
jgi:hypothetical protein